MRQIVFLKLWFENYWLFVKLLSQDGFESDFLKSKSQIITC